MVFTIPQEMIVYETEHLQVGAAQDHDTTEQKIINL